MEDEGLGGPMPAGRCSTWVAMGAVAAVWSVGPLVRAAEAPSPEEKRAVRAAFIIKFMKYTRWPDSAFTDARSPVVLTVLGDALAAHVENIVKKDEHAQGRAITVRRLRPPAADAEEAEWAQFRAALEGAHALYIDSTYDTQVERILDAVAGRDILTIGDSPRFAERGGMLGLVYQRSTDRYLFEASLRAIRKTTIAISSKLLELAKIIGPRENKE